MQKKKKKNDIFVPRIYIIILLCTHRICPCTVIIYRNEFLHSYIIHYNIIIVMNDLYVNIREFRNRFEYSPKIILSEYTSNSTWPAHATFRPLTLLYCCRCRCVYYIILLYEKCVPPYTPPAPYNINIIQS